MEGLEFTVVTSYCSPVHLPLQPNLSRRQVRWSEYLQRFRFKWVYQPGKGNLCADALTRNPPKELCPNLANALRRSRAHTLHNPHRRRHVALLLSKHLLNQSLLLHPKALVLLKGGTRIC